MQTKVIVKGYITKIVKMETNRAIKLIIATNVYNLDREANELEKRGTIWNNFIYFGNEPSTLKVGMYVTVEGHMTLRKDGAKSNEFVADTISLDLISEDKRLKGEKRSKSNNMEMEDVYNSMQKSSLGFD